MERLDKVTFTELTLNLSDEDLANLCKTNRQMRNFCLSNTLMWEKRFKKFFLKYYKQIPGFESIEKYKGNMSWKDYYLLVINELEDFFVNLSVNYLEREELGELIKIMKKEPFNIYEKNLYKVEGIDENIYRNLSSEEKRWVSPEIMIYHILIDNIQDPQLIEEIVNDTRMTDGVIDILLNAGSYVGYRMVDNFVYEIIEKYPNNPNNEYFREYQKMIRRLRGD